MCVFVETHRERDRERERGEREGWGRERGEEPGRRGMFYLYAPSHRQESKYRGLYYTSHGTLVGMRNNSTGPP